MIAIVAQDLQPGALEVQAEHTVGSENPDIELESAVGGYRRGA